MSGSALKLSRGIAGRALHIGIAPRPSNISERQEIFHLLSKYGEIEYFRSLQYDSIPAPNSILLIYKDVASAQRCRDSSPIRFHMSAVGDESQTNSIASKIAPLLAQSTIEDSLKYLDAPKSLPRPPPPTPVLPFEELVDTRDKREARLFQIRVREPGTDMQAHARMGFYYGHFENDYRRAPNDDLHPRVPVRGMANMEWRKPKRPLSRVVDEMAPENDKLGIRPLQQLYDDYERRATASQNSTRSTLELRDSVNLPKSSG